MFHFIHIRTDENVEQKTGEKSKEDECVVEAEEEENMKKKSNLKRNLKRKRLNRQHKKKL